MIPEYLQITGFLSYQKTAIVDFSSFDLACISGSNGAGKSSLLDAMTWALFGQARRRDDAVINSLAPMAEVTFDFEYENNHYRIQRTKQREKTGMLEFYIKDESGRLVPLTEHSMRETEARIQKTLRLDYDTFTNASFFLQGKADQFSQQKSADRKRILSGILGLEIWETYRQNTAEKRKELESELAVTDRLLQEIASELNQGEARKQRLQYLEDRVKQLETARSAKETSLDNLRRLAASLKEQHRLVEMLVGQSQATRQRKNLLQAQLNDRLEEHQSAQEQIVRASEIQAAYAGWQEAVAALERWEKTAASFRQQEEQRRQPLTEIEAQRARLEEERRNLIKQQQQADALQAQVSPLQEKVEQIQAQQKDYHDRLEKRESLEADIKNLQQAQSDLQSENRRLKEEMNEIKERRNNLQAVSGATCSLCGKPLSEKERQSLLDALEADGKLRGDRFRQNKQDEIQNEAKLAEIQSELTRLRQVEIDLRNLAGQLASLSERHEQLTISIRAWEENGLPRLQAVLRTLDESDYAPEARAELARIDAALKELGYDAAAHDAARKHEQQGRSSQDALRKLESASAALVPLEREINTLQEQLNTVENDLLVQEENAHQAQSKYDADSASLPDLNQAEDEVYRLREEENGVRMQVGGARQAVEVLNALSLRQVEYQARRAEITQQISRLKVLERAFSKDGIPALLIEQALPEIEEQANIMLDRLTDGGMSINFLTQRDYKNRAREDKKETLDILINDAAGSREYEMFSGGEAFRVNFAIRLALSRVLAQRAGARLQVLIIDEGFGSQDADGIQRLTEALNLVRHDFAKILVITHLESMKDAFPARIEVEKTSQGSTVKVVNL